jgi:tRNA (mo5U34)-methyltransferase
MTPPDGRSIRDRIAAFPFWYHRIELTPEIVTPGWAPLDAAAYGVPDRLDGLRVLDVGAWDGYWTFEALKRGAFEVVAIDDFSDTMGAIDRDQRAGWGTFDVCREILGYSPEQCRRLEMSVYELDPAVLGRFDMIFFFGTLYHLRYPQLALDRLAEMGTGEILLESAILDDFSPYRGGLGHGYPGDHMVMEFYPGAQYGENPSNWWVPTLQCLVHMVASAGFTGGARAWKLTPAPDGLPACRGFVRAGKPQEETL